MEGDFMNEQMGPNVEKYFKEIKDPSHQPIIYLDLVKHYFDDYGCRQIYFVMAKLSIKKYYPDEFVKVDNLRSENLSIKEVEDLISIYRRK